MRLDSSTGGVAVEAVLGHLQAVLNQRQHGVGGVLDQHVGLLALAGGERLQHEVGGVLPPRRTPDPDADFIL